MNSSNATTRKRRTGQGLTIEGTAIVVSRAGRATPANVPPVAPSILDLAERIPMQPYQSLLDDAMRLAKRCRPLGASTLRVFSQSS